VAAPATVARAERRVSDTRAAPTAAVPAADRVGAPVAATPGAGRTPVFTDDVAMTDARPTGVGLGAATPAADVRPVAPAAGRVIVGLDVVGLAGTPTTGTGVRRVGSDSASLGVDPLAASREDPEGEADAEGNDEADDEFGAGSVAARYVNGVLEADEVPALSVLGEESDRASPDDVLDRMALVGDSS
jgi:hypothetical protein